MSSFLDPKIVPQVLMIIIMMNSLPCMSYTIVIVLKNRRNEHLMNIEQGNIIISTQVKANHNFDYKPILPQVVANYSINHRVPKTNRG